MTDNNFNSGLDIKRVILRFYEFKLFYVAMVFIFIVFAFLINKFKQVEYSNSTTILIEDEKSNSFLGSSKDLFQVADMFGGNKKIENEIGILSSLSIIKSTLEELKFEVGYVTEKNSFLPGLFKTSIFSVKEDLYKNSPIKVVFDPSHVQPTDIKFYINIIDEESFELTAEGEEVGLYNYIEERTINRAPSISVNGTFKFGEKIENDFFNITINLTENYFESIEYPNLYFQFNDINLLTLIYKNNLVVEKTTQTGSLVNINVTGTNFQKITDFLNTLTAVYLDKDLKKKNDAAGKTVEFIDNQISDIADSLNRAESNLERFRSSNQVMDLSFQGQQVVEKINELDTEREKLKYQKRYYTSIIDYLNTTDELDKISAPSSMNVVDPILTNLIQELVTASAQRSSLIKTTGQGGLGLSTLETKIEDLKNTIRENAKSNLNTVDVSINEIDYRINKFQKQISNLPKTELQLIGIERKFKLNDAIYTFLLQKRSEAQIARSTNIPDSEIVDAAEDIFPNQIKPKKMLNFIIALFFGLGIPSAYVLLIDFFNDKIRDKNDIESITDIPILGHIFKNYRRTTTILADRPKSSVSESFRAVRTNFQFFSRGKSKQVILLTSTHSGEGKTFCAINLATAFAMIGKKTLLMEFDLRRPKVHQEFGSSNMLGISSYLINKAILDDIIQPTNVENLFLVTAGPIPPNPVELIGSDKTMEMIEKLKEIYDYIIIDSAPVGVVTESNLLMKYSEVNIYVVRQDVTTKEALTHSLENVRKNKFSNLAILINDVDAKKDAYKYGYDTKYYTESEGKENILSRFFKFKNNKEAS